MRESNRRRNHGRAAVLGVVLCISLAAAAPARGQNRPPAVTDIVNMGGPRLGLTILNQESLDRLREDTGISLRPVVSQFGWQFERRLYTNGDGITMLTEWVPLISGLDQGVALPSLNWLVGLRTSSGTEFAVGPNITALGVGLVVAGGVTVPDRRTACAVQRRGGDVEVGGASHHHDRLQRQAIGGGSGGPSPIVLHGPGQNLEPGARSL